MSAGNIHQTFGAKLLIFFDFLMMKQSYEVQ